MLFMGGMGGGMGVVPTMLYNTSNVLILKENTVVYRTKSVVSVENIRSNKSLNTLNVGYIKISSINLKIVV